jgi:hypothetical protein
LDDGGDWRLVDPTGVARSDVLDKRLSEARCCGKTETFVSNEPRLSMRFWKFRLRGFSASDETKARMREHFEHIAAASSARRLAWIWKPLVPDEKAERERFMQALGRVMREDGAGELFDRYLDSAAFRIQAAQQSGRTLMHDDSAADSEELW